MSSAILYLAIVAIWAVVLVPRWLRGPQAADHASRVPNADEAPAGDRAAGGEVPGGFVPAADGSTGNAGPGDAPLAGRPGPAPVHVQDEDELAPAPAGERVTTQPERAASRARILQARRRTLFTLMALTAGAIGIALINVAAWWVAIPPCVMLAGFIALLRAAAEIDSERARDHARARRAAQHRTGTAGTPPAPAVPDAAAAGGPAEGNEYAPAAGAPGPLPAEVAAATGTDGRPPDRYAWEEPEPGAEVIDISGRVGDQFYDQYSDAAARAIGD